MNTNRWDEPKYQRILSAKLSGNQLTVQFEDGTEISVLGEYLLPPGTPNPLWNEISYTPFEVIVPTSIGEHKIPWTTLRLLTDSEFASQAAQIAEEQAQNIGQKIRIIRQSKGLSSKEVAERAGISPQSLSRIERGHHDVVFTTLRKILAVMGATLSDLAEVNTTSASFSSFLKRTERLGLKNEWLTKRLLPINLVRLLEQANSEAIPTLLKEAAKHLSRIFNWPVEEILQTNTLGIDPGIVQAARFKTQGRTQKNEAITYSAYAYYLAKLALEATSHVTSKILPNHPEVIRELVFETTGAMSLENVLQTIWGYGIPVIPLNDSGAFHGACWRIDGRDVIVLKQITPYQGRWLYDLAHEIGHVALHLANDNLSFIEPQEISPFEDNDSDEEWEANKFASELLLFGRAEELTQMCVDIAKGKMEYLKSAVIQVAAKEHVPVDVLANYIAFRLSTQGANWWGAANNLQITEPSPSKIARSILLENIDLTLLNNEDQELLIRAVAD